MSDSEFAGMGFAVGSVTGARSFKVDKLGRLTGVTYPTVWRPGENEAECKKTYSAPAQTVTYTPVPQAQFPGAYDNVPPGARLVDERVDYSSRGDYQVTRDYVFPNGMRYSTQVVMDQRYGAGYAIGGPVFKGPEPRLPDGHGLDVCQHGFYAYYDGSNDYNKDGMVSAVVEGYGETLIGSRGFRSMKARIVAMQITDKVKWPLAQAIMRNYPDVPQFDTFKAMVREFPCDGGELAVVPELPEASDDFWTRSA